MAKAYSSVIGVDLGRFSIKAVVVNRRGNNKFVVSNYAMRPVSDSRNGENLAADLKAVLKDVGGSAKGCAVAVSNSEALIRIIEQPQTPTEILREGLRLNGMSLLNQDCHDFVLDCDLVKPAPAGAELATGGAPRLKYLVGGLPRARVSHINEAFQKNRRPVQVLQLAPVCAFNAFEFAKPDAFKNEAFILLDIGHLSSTVTVGVKSELILVRSIDYGGKALHEALKSAVEMGGDAAPGDESMNEIARVSLSALTREVSSSIGFFEGRREETITRVFISGGPARSKVVLQILEEELHMPFEAWNPFESCELALPAHRRDSFAADMGNLNVACGAAADLLKRN
jgi:type IV pilus assembly protein PilM